jgi:hypothetical protein
MIRIGDIGGGMLSISCTWSGLTCPSSLAEILRISSLSLSYLSAKGRLAVLREKHKVIMQFIGRTRSRERIAIKTRNLRVN